MYDKLVAKVNNIDTSGFVLKIQYHADRLNLEKKIPDTSGLVKKTDYSAKISEIQSKIPSTSGLATKSALTAVENKTPDVSSLVKKTDYGKYITTPEFNNLVVGVFTARLAQANLVTKTDFDTKLISLNKKIHSNKANHLLLENELKKLQTFDSSYFRGRNYFENDDTHNYLVIQPVNKYLKKISNTDHISEWTSKGLSIIVFIYIK